MSHRTKRLNEVIPDWDIGYGIFSALQTCDVPWAEEDIASSLDLAYHGNWSGDKIISPLVRKYMEGDTLTTAELSALARTAFVLYGPSWVREYQTLLAQYDPIENYSMTETMTNDQTVDSYGKTSTRTDNLSHGISGTETRTPNLTETTTPNLTTTAGNTIHGFNSTDGVPSTGSEQTATGTNTVTSTGTEGTSHSSTETDTGTSGVVDGGQDTHTRNYRLTRSGNIGVTTSQQMLQSERDLWMWSYFEKIVFPDLDRVLTIPIY